MGNVYERPSGSGVILVHPNYNEIKTPELYNILLNECDKTSKTIQSLQRDKRFDHHGRSLVCQLMLDLEKTIHVLNVNMVGYVPKHNRAGVEELNHLQDKIAKLSEENKCLKEENAKIERILKEYLSATERGGRSKKEPNKFQYDGRQVSGHPSMKPGCKTNIPLDQEYSTFSMKQLQSKLKDQKEEIDEWITRNESAQIFIQSLSQKTEKLEHEIEKLLEEKEFLTKRLSTIVSKRLVDDNPAITDLSDPNRPQKLGEVYSEMYDNEWTDAFEALRNHGYGEQEAIVTLRLTLLNVLEFCRSKSSNLLKKTEEAVNFLFEEFKNSQGKKSQKHLTITRSQSEQWLKACDTAFDGKPDDCVDVQERWKPKDGTQVQANEQESEMAQNSDVIVQKLKVFRKEVAKSMVPMVQKAYLSASWRSEFVHELKPFIKKCIFLGWMMMVQSPPMCLAACKPGERFDKHILKEYTKSGPTVDFVVWPALYLYENGPLVGKGIAEGK